MGETSPITWVAAAAAACFGFAWLALAMDVHWHQVHGTAGPSPVARRMLRGLGVIGLATSAVLCFVADRPSMAVLVWILMLAATAATVAMTLTWRPRVLLVLWPWRAA